MKDVSGTPLLRCGALMAALAIPAAWLGVVGASTRASAAAPAHASMILDANSGAVLHSAAADELRHPASLTKMMTLYLAFEAIEQGRLTLRSKVKVSQEAAAVAPSKLELEPGEEIALVDAIKALITKSANDMAVAIAERIGGTEVNFARLMTEKARQLGMTKTTFRNASGLPDPAQVTTARDMITLALHLQDDFPQHYALFALRSFTYNGASYRNHNTLLNSYRGTDGIKTGYTRMSGFNLVASVRRDGKHLIGAIFGGASAASRNVYLKALLDRSFPKASTTKSRKPMLIAKAAPSKAKPPVVAALTPPRPQPAVRPPKPDTARSAPSLPSKPAQPATAEVKVAAAPVAAPPPAAEPLAETPEPAIQVAKVRRIMVAPRTSRSGDSSTRAEGTDEAAAITRPHTPEAPVLATAGDRAEASTTVAPIAQPAGTNHVRDSAVAESIPTAQAAATHAPAALAPPPFLATRTALASAAAPVPPPAPIQIPSPAKVAPSAPVVRGSPPSTLQAQADNLARNGRALATASLATPPAFLQGPKHAPAPTPAPAGAYQIQIGAYATPAEAQQKLAAVRQQAAALLASHQPLTLAVHKGSRQLYRARFGGFSASAAASACNELRRLSHDCFVNKAE